MKPLAPLTFGVGDRFAHQAAAQLQAFVLAEQRGISLVPVWNKSNREHLTVQSAPESVLQAAQTAVQKLQWKGGYHIDADHITLETVDRFLPHSDFFTLDVADSIGQTAAANDLKPFLDAHQHLIGELALPGCPEPIRIDRGLLVDAAEKYLAAAVQAGKIYRRIAAAKGDKPFVTEVSMDETDQPQTPPELLIILAALAAQAIPVQTIAPKFSGRFNKGVDYVGDLQQFEREFRNDLAVLQYAIDQFGLPPTLKLSVHSGSDKYSLYPIIRAALRDTGAGLHIKTAGTSWLEEVIGLAESGGQTLQLAKEIYAAAWQRRDELCAPYASVIDIRSDRLPAAGDVQHWSAQQFADALRHDGQSDDFNPDMRQLLHVGYKIAAEMGTRFTDALQAAEPAISRNVTNNLFQRHMLPLFGNP